MFLCIDVFAANNYTVINMSEFSSIGTFSEGLCAVQDKNTNRWGFVNTNKNWVISPQFQSASYFKNGLCAVNTVERESVLINCYGEIIFKRSEYRDNISSDNYYIEKHGKYNILFDGYMLSDCWITLLDENYNNILSNDIILRNFKANVNGASNESRTLFWAKNQAKVYNYKGVDITKKLEEEYVVPSSDLIVNDKYIIGLSNRDKPIIDPSNFGLSNPYKETYKAKCFDILGNKVAEFEYGGELLLDGDFLIGDNIIYNIPENKTIFDDPSIDIKEIQTYYNKYFTVSKENGTSALYTKSGGILCDFGKWDTIIPLSTSNNIIVSAGNKYGLADYEGNVILPLENINASTLSNGKYIVFSKDKYTDLIINPTSLNSYSYSSNNDFYAGYKYHKIENIILDDKFNIVYSDNSINYHGGDKLVDNGIIKQKISGSSSYNGYLIFEDSGVKVNLDCSRLEFDVLPVIQNGRTLVPMRAIFEALGADVEWNGETKTITATNSDVTIKMQIGNNTLTKNGVRTQMDVCPQLVDGRTMVPVRAVSDSFNVTVDWDSYTQTVSLFTN